ncbi:MAG TPA: glutathione peroxidase [Fimbriimonadaceae bacterium]|nr:glutathione peroxidase [Fimbriimonadaceae bacterium]
MSALLILSTLAATFAFHAAPKTPGTIYDFTMPNIDGKEVPLSKFKGQVLLVVNVASFCGNTPQYKGLEAMYAKYKDQKFAVLGFPANQFGAQEPGSNSEIKEFCTKTYDVKFPMFSKIVVKGDGINPLYTWLIANSGSSEDIHWNFEKFLIDREGKVIGRFSPKTQPDDPKLVAAIEAALASK